MSGGVGFGTQRIGIAALRHPRFAVVCMLGFLIAVAISLPRVSFDDDIHRVFLSDSALSEAQRSYEADPSHPGSVILIHVTSPDPLTAADMTALRDISLDLEFIEGVSSVASPFSLRWPPAKGVPSGTPVFGQQIGEDYDIDLARFRDLETGLPTFVNAARTAMLMGASVDLGAATFGTTISTIKTKLANALPTHLKADISGEDVISAEIVSGLKSDLLALNLWGAAVIALAAFAILRDIRMALLAVVPALIGAAGVLALSVWLDYPLTVLSNVIPILLLVLGVADGVHLAGHLKAGGSAREAIEEVGPACGLTALTTAVAFASVTLSGNAQLFEFAVLGAAGTMLSFVVVLVTFALLAGAITPSDRPLPGFSAAIARHLATAGVRWPRITVTACIALLAVSAVGFGQTRAWFPLYQNLPDCSATPATNDAISADFGGVFRMIVETGGSWDDTVALADELEDLNGPETVLSEVNLARWLGHPDRRPDPAEIERLPTALMEALRAPDGAARLYVSVAEPMRSEGALKHFDTLFEAAQERGASRIIGLPTIMRKEAVTLIDQLSFGLVVAALGAIGLCALAFRSVRMIPVLIVPNVLPLMMTGASLLLWARGQLTPTAVLALTISFGIAIDDTVHFLSRFTAARARGETPWQAITSATSAAGQLMVVTTLLLTAGLCVTLFSGFAAIRQFGGMMVMTLWVALLVDLLLLPALLTWRRPRDVSF